MKLAPTGTTTNTSQLLVYGGQLVADGTPDAPIVFTSGNDDSVGGDSNGDGAATAAAPGDWLSIAFSASTRDEALRAPVSVIDSALVRFGGEGTGSPCQGYGAVDVGSLGRVHISRSEFRPVGRGWSFGYDIALSVGTDGRVTLRAGDGQRLRFTPGVDGSYLGDPGVTATLTAAAGGGWTLLTRARLRHDFDPAGRLTALRDANGQGIGFDYDGGGRLVAAASGSARSLRFGWDEAAGRLTRVDLPDGRWVGYGYTAGLLTSVRDLAGATTVYGYDSAGRLTTLTSPQGRVIRQAYDPVTGRVSDQRDARDNHTRFGWDPATQTATMTDPRGGVWKDVYRGNVLVRRVDPLGGTTGYEYDANLQLVAATDPRGIRSVLAYNAAGDLVSHTGPTRAVTSVYDAAHRITASVNGRGAEVGYDYDAAGNLTAIRRPDPAGGEPLVTGYRYDDRGLLTSVTDAQGSTTTYGHDVHGDLTSVRTAEGGTTTFGYDPAGRLVRVVDPRGNEPGADPDRFATTYGYDDADRPTVVRDPVGRTSTTSYDGDGRVSAVRDAKGRTTDYSYDPDGNLTAVQGPDPAVPATVATYDPNGNLSAVTDTAGRTVSYTYDLANRVTRASGPLGSTSLGYDAAGNLTALTAPNGAKTLFLYDTASRLAKIDYPSGTADVSYTYDVHGNRARMSDGTYSPLGLLSSVTGPAGTTTNAYNWAGRLTSTTTGGVTTSYGYDGDGRRLSATAGGVSTKYGWEPLGYDLALEQDGAGATVRRYAYGAGRVAMTVPGTGPAAGEFYYHGDALGSVLSVTDNGGAEQWAYRWEPYGLPRATDRRAESAPANPMRWAGEYTDPDGTSHLRARQYDPATGRFTAPDPANAEPASATYLYGSANPLVFTDPLGLLSFRAGLKMVGNMAGYVAQGAGTLAPVLAATGIGAPVTGVLGGVALTAGVITAAASTYLAWDTCQTTKGGCGGAVVTAALDSMAAIPGGRAAHAALGGINKSAKAVDDILATPQVGSTKLQNIVNNLYKGTTHPSRVGNGTTMDAIRNELASGLPTRGRMHLTKGQESLRGLDNWLTTNRSLGLGRDAPSECTIRRVLQRVDPDALDAAISSWLATRRCAREATRVIAVDGKSARGARHGDARAVHLLAAFDTATGAVLGQTVVDGKTNEINAFAPLLDRIDITGAIVTADALHTQRAHVAYLGGRGAHYLLTVKANQPRLLAQLRRLPWADVPVADHSTDKGHARLESRTVKLTAVGAGIAFPGAALAIQVTRRRKPSTARRWRTETVYAITDLTEDEIGAGELADALRAHWGIENRLHWIRDVTFAEDLSQVRTGHGPAVMASLRNLAISLHRSAGAKNIAAACRHTSRHPNRVLRLIR